MTVKVNHPKYKMIHNFDTGQFVVCFEFGYYEKPSQEANAAWDRINTALATITDEDRQLVRKWNGSIVKYQMSSNLTNPEITDDMVQECVRASEEAFPEFKCVWSWHNSSNGIHGVSVKMAKRTEEPK